MHESTSANSNYGTPVQQSVAGPHRAPVLIVTVDTEEEFDWSRPPAGQQPRLTHCRELTKLQDLFDEEGARATYVVDYPLLVDPACVSVLTELHRRGTCELGTHLHPWVNPPQRESAAPRNSYLSNLPRSLQQEKLAVLTAAFEASFGFAPRSFKAGRYGLDLQLVPDLVRLGYTVDGSMVAYTDFSVDGGPDFRHCTNVPHRIGEDHLLEVPCSVAYTRQPFAQAHAVHQLFSTSWLRRLRLVGLLWHTRLLRKIVLSPELHGPHDLIAAIDALAAAGTPVFQITMHSPSVAPGNTPYIRTDEERDALFETLRAVIRHARRRHGAVCRTLAEYADSYQEAMTP